MLSNDQVNWRSLTEEEEDVCARRSLEAAYIALRGIDKESEDGDPNRVDLFVSAIKEIRRVERDFCKELATESPKMRVHGLLQNRLWIVASAVCAHVMGGDIKRYAPYSAGSVPFVKFAGAVSLFARLALLDDPEDEVGVDLYSIPDDIHWFQPKKCRRGKP